MEDPKASSLKPEFKILHNICQYCIFPRLGSLEKVTDNDLMIDLKREHSGNVCQPFSIKNTHHMKNATDHEDSAIGSKRKIEESEATNRWGQLLTAMAAQSQNLSNPETQTLASSDTIPSSLSVSLHFDSTPGAPFVPTTQQAASLNTFISTEFVNKILHSSITAPVFSDGAAPSLPTSFATLSSFCSSAQQMDATLGDKAADHNPEDDPRPSKRSETEKDINKLRKDIIKLFEGLSNMNDLILYLFFESQIMRSWTINNLCPALQIEPPPENAAPNPTDFPKPDWYTCQNAVKFLAPLPGTVFS
ncbi:hypothetical protein A2U01_0014732, partial [Trifolium medium]|nr:hypothetical protein [Trifolium medium]